eukprot:13373434-Alexandrium_andersonii.AAC.1
MSASLVGSEMCIRDSSHAYVRTCTLALRAHARARLQISGRDPPCTVKRTSILDTCAGLCVLAIIVASELLPTSAPDGK